MIVMLSTGGWAQTNTSKLPDTARDFLNEHFSSVSVEKADENSNWKIWADERYEVRLSNGIELDFDEHGNIIEIDTKNNQAIPMTALPASISAYLDSNHPDAKVIGWEKNDQEQEVELEDGTEVEFDAQGQFRRLD